MIDNRNFYFQSFAQWRYAITKQCNIKLTPEYTRSRISALKNRSDKSTKEFEAKYGSDYLQQVIKWFEQAQIEG